MRLRLLLTYLLLTALLVIGASGAVKAKLASGVENLAHTAPLADGAVNWLTHQGKSTRITTGPPGSPVATKKGGTETVQRWMPKAELKATQETGLLRGGREGTHYVTDAVNANAQRAQQRLALPQTPEVKVTLQVPNGSCCKNITIFLDALKEPVNHGNTNFRHWSTLTGQYRSNRPPGRSPRF